MPGWLAKLMNLFKGVLPGGSTPLCDSCKYDYGNVCNRPERPNAMRCPDYKSK